MQLLRPFGPSIGKFHLPQAVIDAANESAELVIGSPELGKQLDWSEQLVGKVKQEFAMPQFFLSAHMPFFSNCVKQYVAALSDLGCAQNPPDLKVGIRSAWFIRSVANDFNPAHIHSNCQFSSVGYIKLPEWEEELSEDSKDHHPCRGQIEFITGNPQPFSKHQTRYRPNVGDFYIFPSHMIHLVYPFQSAGERRSFSINFLLSR